MSSKIYNSVQKNNKYIETDANQSVSSHAFAGPGAASHVKVTQAQRKNLLNSSRIDPAPTQISTHAISSHIRNQSADLSNEIGFLDSSRILNSNQEPLNF